MFASFAEQSLLIFGLRVFWKQNRSFQFFPAWAYCAPTTLLRMPASVVDAFVWSGIVYWLVGLAPDAGRYVCMARCSASARSQPLYQVSTQLLKSHTQRSALRFKAAPSIVMMLHVRGLHCSDVASNGLQ